jgi:hypothetical protein
MSIGWGGAGLDWGEDGRGTGNQGSSLADRGFSPGSPAALLGGRAEVEEEGVGGPLFPLPEAAWGWGGDHCGSDLALSHSCPPPVSPTPALSEDLQACCSRGTLCHDNSGIRVGMTDPNGLNIGDPSMELSWTLLSVEGGQGAQRSRLQQGPGEVSQPVPQSHQNWEPRL